MNLQRDSGREWINDIVTSLKHFIFYGVCAERDGYVEEVEGRKGQCLHIDKTKLTV